MSGRYITIYLLLGWYLHKNKSQEKKATILCTANNELKLINLANAFKQPSILLLLPEISRFEMILFECQMFMNPLSQSHFLQTQWKNCAC